MRPVLIRYGCSWGNDARAAKILGEAVRAVNQEVKKRAAGQSWAAAAQLPGKLVEGRRLRATPALTVLQGIELSIESADILLFDLTPETGHAQGKSNVLLELGIAIAKKKEVYVCHRGTVKLEAVPSDLQGILVCRIAKSRFEPALHRRLCMRSLQIVCDRANSTSSDPDGLHP